MKFQLLFAIVYALPVGDTPLQVASGIPEEIAHPAEAGVPAAIMGTLAKREVVEPFYKRQEEQTNDKPTGFY